MTTPPTLRERARRARRLGLAVLWTGVCYLAWAGPALLLLPFRRAGRRWAGAATRGWSRGMLAILGVGLRWAGPRPRAPFLLVSNHLSYVDILTLGATLGPTFVAKHDIARWPVLGHLARATGTIFVDRARRRDALRVMREMDQAWAEGAGIVLFPEGTSSRGEVVHPFRTALLEWAVHHRRAVHAVALHYRTTDPRHPAADTVCWWGDVQFGDHLTRFLVVPATEASLTFAGPVAPAGRRAELADTLHALVARLYDTGRGSLHPAGDAPAQRTD